MPTDLTVAFAGHAPTRESNTRLLLEDFLHLPAPDEEGYYDKPDRWGSITFYALLTDGQVPAGLKAALNIAASIGDPEAGDVKFNIITDGTSGDVRKWAKVADSVKEAADPLAHLVSTLADSPRPYLLVNWDENDADDEELIRQAHAAGKIRVSDLARGLVELVPDDEDTEPEPEAEPEEEPAPRRKSSRRRVQELEEQESELEEEPATTAPPQEEPQVNATSSDPSTLEEELAAAHRQQTMQSTIAVGAIAADSEALREILTQISRASFYLQAQDTARATLQLTDVGWSPLTEELMAAEESLVKILEKAVPYDDVVDATEKSAPKKAQQRKKVVWDDDAKEWKAAGRGRTRRGVRVGWMDADGNVTEEA